MSDTSTDGAAAPRTRTGLIVGIVAAVVVLGAIGGGLLWFFRDDAPPPVNLDTAVGSVDQGPGSSTKGTAGGTGTTSGGGAVVDGEVSGTWTVDTASGEFNYEDATSSFVGFRVEEELTVGSATAVGRTPAVSGELVIAGDSLTTATITADLTELTTNDSRRDSKARGALETGQFPEATFTLTQPVSFGDAAATGQDVAVDATGDLTIHGVTRQVTIPLQAKLVGDTIVVVGSTEITFADYGVEPPTAPVVLSVDDHGILELQLLFVRS